MRYVQIRRFVWSIFSRIRTEYKEISPPDARKYGPEETPYLDTFHAVQLLSKNISSSSRGAPSLTWDTDLTRG